jgi:hypothetical protein
MKLRNLLTVALVALLVAPAATAYVPVDSTPTQQGEPAAVATDGQSSSETAAAQERNYTRLYIEEGYRSSEVKPGESTTFNVTVGNSEDESVELDPHVVLPQVRGRPLAKSWVGIESADTTLEAGEERTFTVNVSVPSDADLGEYRALVAFTNETVTYRPGQPPRPVHAATINVDVFEEPTVRISSDRYYHTQVQAGDDYTYEIEVENTGEQAVPVNPTLETQENRRRYRGSEQTVERSWFEIDAPSEVAPGETTTVNVTVSPPESASVGDYDAEIDLGLQDPARPDRGDYWQQVDLRFQVWTQPDEPFETTFAVSEATESASVTLSTGSPANDRSASFDVSFVTPNGTVVEAERVRVSNDGHVSLGGDGPRGESQGPYTSRGSQQEFVYRIDDPAAGRWTARIMPQNAVDFGYEITRDEG